MRFNLAWLGGAAGAFVAFCAIGPLLPPWLVLGAFALVFGGIALSVFGLLP